MWGLGLYKTYKFLQNIVVFVKFNMTFAFSTAGLKMLRQIFLLKFNHMYAEWELAILLFYGCVISYIYALIGGKANQCLTWWNARKDFLELEAVFSFPAWPYWWR